jgi:hypothetical protein
MIEFIMECMGLVVKCFLGGIFLMIAITTFCIAIYWIQYLVKGDQDGHG